MDWRRAVMPDDWGKIFAFDTPIVEIFVRITIVYFFLVLLLRITLKRQTGGTTSLRDILVLVLIADAVQNGMAGQYTSVTDALVIAATLIFWAFVLPDGVETVRVPASKSRSAYFGSGASNSNPMVKRFGELVA